MVKYMDGTGRRNKLLPSVLGPDCVCKVCYSRMAGREGGGERKGSVDS
jgi:hypothetical protein